MHPYLFEIPNPFSDDPFHLRAFGVMVALAFLLGANIYQRLARRYGDNPETDPQSYSRVTMWILVGIFAGARLMYVVVEILRQSETGHTYLSDPLKIFAFWEGGLVMYGGLIGGIVGGLWCARKEKLRLLHALDLGLIAGFVGQTVGRIGCYMVGDDFGSIVPERFKDLSWPLVLHVPNPLPDGSLFGADNAGQVLWATQNWMSFNALLIAFIAWRILKGRRYAGQVSLWVVLIYSVTRYTVESFRGDEIRGTWFGGAISTSQLISIVCFLFAVVMLWRLRARKEEFNREPAA